MKSKKLDIEIWSDVQCPFCYIGKHKFEEAFADFEHKDSINIIWKSFQLNPQLKTDTSISTTEYLAKHKRISIDEAQNMKNHVKDAGKSIGLKFDFDTAVVANTHKSHQLLHLANKHGVQNELKEELFEAHFTNGKNIDDPTYLIELGSKIGLKEKEISEALESEKYYTDVQKDIKEAQQLGIRGVPYFVFDRKYAISGAHDPITFSQTLNKAYNDWENKTQTIETTAGDSCEIDGDC